MDGLTLTNFVMSWFTVKRFPLVMDQLVQLSPLRVSPIVGSSICWSSNGDLHCHFPAPHRTCTASTAAGDVHGLMPLT